VPSGYLILDDLGRVLGRARHNIAKEGPGG
jgi:hypothetical protein